MGTSHQTTEAVKTADGEVVDGDRPAAVIGQAAKKRKRQKALAAVAANGHVSKLSARKPPGSNGAVVEHEPPVEDVPEDVAAVEAIGAVELSEQTVGDVPAGLGEAPSVEECDEYWPADAERALDATPAERSHRARERAARRARRQARPHSRAAMRAKAARTATPAGRRAELVATAARFAATEPAAETEPAAAGRTRVAKYARRLAAVVATAMIPAAIYALVSTGSLAPSLSRTDASFMSAALMTADQRVRRQLVRLKPGRTAAAVARTRDAALTARSLSLELANTNGGEAVLLRRALALESAWLDAVGSVLANPRSPLREELVSRDARLRPALNALPVPAGRRKGGAVHLVRYANSRSAAKR